MKTANFSPITSKEKSVGVSAIFLKLEADSSRRPFFFVHFPFF